MAKKFRLTLEPITPKKPVCFYGGLEGLVGINVNGTEVFGNGDGNMIKEPIGYTIDWLLRNFKLFSSNGMPKDVVPAISLYEALIEPSEEYCERNLTNRRISYIFPKKGKENFGEWLSSHNFGYPYLGFPIVFQRRDNQVEISWDLNRIFFINPTGCEYVSLDTFKEGVLDIIKISLMKIKSLEKVYDYGQYEVELKSLYGQATSN